MGRGVAARISEISFTRIRKVNFFYKESKSNKKNSGGWEGRVWGLARVSDFFFQSNPSLKKIFFFLEGVKVREDWLV